MITSPAFAAKRYAVLGLARSGRAVIDALLASGAEVTAWDRQPEAREEQAGRCRIADPLKLDLRGFAGVIVSPGVPLNTHPIVGHAAHFDVPVIGDIELFAQARADLPPHTTIGVTGTNGKSTTVALIHHIVRTAGMESVLGGNIGDPILARDPLGAGGVYVLELSSFQIDLTYSLDCDIAVLTNITPDHLDRYAGFAEYVAAKARLFAMQSADNYALFGCSDAPTQAIMQREHERRGEGRALCTQSEPWASDQHNWPALQGAHNLSNAVIAAKAALGLGIGRDIVLAGLRSFAGLAHRMEHVCDDRGVSFYNDSKATNSASAAPALGAFPRKDGRARVHWIVGGIAKEDELGECEAHLDNIAIAYTVGEAGPRFAEMLSEKGVRVERSELISEAVRRARAAAQPGDIVLLSPACASYDQFRDYEKRGDHFRQLVDAIADCDAPSPAHQADALKGERPA